MLESESLLNELEVDEGKVELEWMWGDAGLSLPGMKALAKANPLRWGRGSDEKVREQLEGYIGKGKGREVKVRVVGYAHQQLFPSPSAAIEWIEVGSRSGVFHSLRGTATLEWMWADAGIPLVPGMKSLAKSNPMRWGSGIAREVKEQLEGHKEDKGKERAVRVRVVWHDHEHRFESPKKAVKWIESCSQEETFAPEHTKGSTALSFWGGTAQLLAAPALALFCRAHSPHNWWNKNLFVASGYARRVTSVPLALASSQPRYTHNSLPPASCFNPSFVRGRVHWRDYDASPARLLAETFIMEAAMLPEKERPQVIKLPQQTLAESDSDDNGEDHVEVRDEVKEYWGSWTRFHEDKRYPSSFWVIYTKENRGKEGHGSTKMAVVAFRGGDGGVEDSKNHVGSPARAFIAGADEASVPWDALPVEILELLVDQGFEVTLIGYSLGGIPALACCLYLFGAEESALGGSVVLGGTSNPLQKQKQRKRRRRRKRRGKNAEKTKGKSEGKNKKKKRQKEETQSTNKSTNEEKKGKKKEEEERSNQKKKGKEKEEEEEEEGKEDKIQRKKKEEEEGEGEEKKEGKRGMKACILLNCATLFWPIWLNNLLPEGPWWDTKGGEDDGEDGQGGVPPRWWENIESWCIADDPLSDAMPGGQFLAPLAPGVTKVLPTRASGTNIIDNHSFVHFVSPLPRFF